MTHTTIHKKAPRTCDSKGLAADTTGADFPTAAHDGKAFASLAARFALAGHTLHQSGPGDGPGPVSYLAERWGMVRHLPTLADAERFLLQVGGAHGL